MFRNRLYYALKPIMPRRLRTALRRLHAQRLLRNCAGVWPILESSATPPQGWRGWPEGKQFAVVLTHDVEGPVGLSRVRQLAEVEMELGFRSSFNFIPEGPYSVSDELRAWLGENGFEVGVHDLHHDGKLYRSRESFRESAGRINAHARRWGAVGFRAGFMLHNLEWLHALDILYDASTFDTDPFEPQPDGVGTIFPFWVPRPAPDSSLSPCRNLDSDLGRDHASQPIPSSASGLRAPDFSAGQAGYVELPYTLVQDSTLFLYLEQPTNAYWVQKADWVAAKGGMVLVNVHPDYTTFDPGRVREGEFPVAQYADLLRHLKSHYAGRFYHALPRELAAHVAQMRPLWRTRAPGRRVCMLSYSDYRHDIRVVRYAEALARRGDHVEVFGVHELGPREAECLCPYGVRFHILKSRARRQTQTVFSHTLELLRFTALATGRISVSHLRRPYDLVHVHNMPDFVAFAALLPRLTGTRVILDIHDLVPEFYASKHGGKEDGIAVRLARLQEKLAARFAHHVIISNHLWRKRIIERCVPASRCSVFINYLHDTSFKDCSRNRNDDRFVLVFPGGLYTHQGLDVAVRAMAEVVRRVPNAELHIYGEGPAKPALESLTQDLRLQDCVRFFSFVPFERVPEIIANADLGVVPKRADSFGNEAYSTKIMEFMAQGTPVVVSRTRIDAYYFQDGLVRFFESGNPADLAKQIVCLAEDPVAREALSQKGRAFARANSWGVKQEQYLALVDTLLADPDKVQPVC